MPTDAEIEAAAKVFCDGGFEIHSPADGDLDDLERHWWNTLRAALEAAERVRAVPPTMKVYGCEIVGQAPSAEPMGNDDRKRP